MLPPGLQITPTSDETTTPAPPLAQTRTRRKQPLHPHATLLSALVSEDAIDLALAASEGTLQAYLRYDRAHNGSASCDFLSNSILAACILADAPIGSVTDVSDCRLLGADQHTTLHAAVVTKTAMHVVNLDDGTQINIPRHYGDYLISREKNIWSTQMDHEVQRLLAIPVARLIHRSEIPAGATGPFRTQWAFAYREANIAKGALARFRPRIAIGHPLKDGIDMSNDAITTFATSADMTTRKILLGLTASDDWIDYTFDISQFHQTTEIPTDMAPIIVTQPTGYEQMGPNGEPKHEMFWLLLVAMQGLKIASALANKQLDKLLMQEGFFLRGLGDTRIFTFYNETIGGIRIIFHSDDGVGAAQKQAGIDYVRTIIEKIYKISAFGPWDTMCGFTVTRDRAARSVTLSAETMIKNGVGELMPNELLITTNAPSTDALWKLTCVPILSHTDPGYSTWLDDVTWFRRAVGWALHASQVHPTGIGALSVLCGLAKSPGPDGVKALKHYLAWLNSQRHLGITYGGNGNTSVKQSPLRDIELSCNLQEPVLPYSLIIYSDSDLRIVSRYCVVALLNRGCIFVQSRLQHSAAPDITASEAFAFSVAAIMADVIRGRMCDFGFASAVQHPTPILTDNDAVKRIASNAASAKRSLMVLRRLAFVLHLTEQEEIIAVHVSGKLNLSNFGTKYVTRHEIAWASRMLRNIQSG
jgi:hypothetical protein